MSPPSDTLSSGSFSCRAYLRHTHLLSSRCPAAVAAVIGGYLLISLSVIPGRRVPSARTFFEGGDTGGAKATVVKGY
jgi:hypothetical protein